MPIGCLPQTSRHGQVVKSHFGTVGRTMLSLYMSVTGRAAGQRFGPGSHFSEPWILWACEVVLTGACTMTWWKDTWPKLRKELVISGSMDELCWTRMLIHCQSRFSWMSLMESSGTGFVYPWLWLSYTFLFTFALVNILTALFVEKVAALVLRIGVSKFHGNWHMVGSDSHLYTHMHVPQR